VLAPAGTPPEVVSRLNREIAAVVELPEVKERVISYAATPERETPEEFAKSLKAEVVKWSKIVDATGVRLE
jgi:tripartite-type tricarboxylate transporter receptor subunit TctC